MELLEHEHPLNLIDLQPSYPEYEEVYSDEEEDGKEKEVSITKKDFRCHECDGCGLEINYFHRYYYRCDQCNYSLHKYCGAKLPPTLEHASHPHQITLSGLPSLTLAIHVVLWLCSICREYTNLEDLCYYCAPCRFMIHLDCVRKERAKNETIYHPSHRHPLMPIPGQILANCNACGKKHEGIFYLCFTCHSFLIHKDCVFLPKNLLIQHTHPLTLAYTFLRSEQEANNFPRCRLCDDDFIRVHIQNLWIYKCQKCRYYTHLDCATSRKEPFMSIFLKPGIGKPLKNFEDDDYPALLHLPFPDQTYSIQKHLFSKEIKSPRELDTNEMMKKYHQHPLILVDTQGSWPTSSRTTITKLSSCHDPMKNVQLLCNGCLCPIMAMPFFKFAQGCNFVLHEWCTQLPSELKDHTCHSQHTLTLQSHVSHLCLGVFYCHVCDLRCNGFSYSCIECDFYIDINCAFMPEKITHEAHQDHLLSRSRVEKYRYTCHMCRKSIHHFSWSCVACDFHLHPACAFLLPKTIRHKLDKHPMKLSYFPIENHKSNYFCEVCEEELDPTHSFYHCHECAWSIHSYCAPLILGYERNAHWFTYLFTMGVYSFVNIKFGGTHKIEGHSHPLTFSQGIESDGGCLSCSRRLGSTLIFKCLECKFAAHLDCCKIIND